MENKQNNIMDPYKIMQITNKNFTLDQLRTNYKRLVLEYHPDRTKDVSGSPIFQTLKFAYDYLLNELKSKDADKGHHELKMAANTKDSNNLGTNTKFVPGEKFDVGRFNQIFSDARISEVYDDGYGEWKEDAPTAPKAIVTYKEPEALMGGRFASAYELGNAKVTDYSGDNLGSGLKYMDFKLAHTTTRLVDENIVDARPEFKTVEELKNHRGNVSFTASAEDVRKRHLQKIEDEKIEATRQKTLKEKDGLIESLYKKSHKLMLSAFS
jgi:curved DNA-binding protein CbpA